jgi:hypothetical protein
MTTGRIMRPTAIVLALVFVLLSATELGTRAAIRKVSRIERRIAVEQLAAQQTRDPRSVVLLGNSLLLFGLRDSSVAKIAPPGWTTRRFVIEQTRFLDWKYGIKQLLREGARPALIVLALDAKQLVSNATRGDYSAARLVGASDVIAFGHESGLHRTEISGLLLSHYSAFYGFRIELRKILMSRIVPHMDQLAAQLVSKPTGALAPAHVDSIAGRRLREIQDIADAARVRLVLVVPPTPGQETETAAVVRAGARVGVDVAADGLRAAYTDADFVDSYHLNAAGADRFEASLRAMLYERLVK